jgi:hypothetical protein
MMMKSKIIYSILTLLIGCASFAQVSVTNTGILYITGSSDILYAGSDFTNNSGSALTNNGQLHVKGNLTNDQSSMAIGTGTLYLIGSSAQAVNGSQPFKTYHLNTNNSAGITLNNDLSVSGTHTFTSGIITTSATPNYLIYEAGSSYAGDADSRHVNGWVKKFGSTNFIFPVGDLTYERTVALNSLSASSEFYAKYFINTPNSYSYVSPIWDVNESEYWQISRASGGTATVTLNWDNSKVYFPNWIVADITVAGYIGSAWANNGGVAIGSAATTGTITSSSTSSFSFFALASKSYILPLTLTSFNATRPGNYTQITWTTEGELSADHFVVERSDDGRSFYTIAQLPARNSGLTEQYSTRDNAAIRHTAYYRLRIADTGGREKLSKTVAITVIGSNQLSLLTNPVHDKVTLLAGPELNGQFDYMITAINGQLTQQGKLLFQNGGSYQLELRNPTPGMYSLKVSNGLENFRYKLIVQ